MANSWIAQGKASGVHDYHQFFQHPAHEDGDADCRRSLAARHAAFTLCRWNFAPSSIASSRAMTTKPAFMGLGGGDADPNSDMNVWMSNGGTHLWNMHETKPATAWEAEIDRLMNAADDHAGLQETKADLRSGAADHRRTTCRSSFLRRRMCWSAPRRSLRISIRPVSILTCLWNADELYFRQQGVACSPMIATAKPAPKTQLALVRTSGSCASASTAIRRPGPR